MSTNSSEDKLLKSPFNPEQPELPKKKYHIAWQGNGTNFLSAITKKDIEKGRAEQISLFGKEEGYNKPVRVVEGEVLYILPPGMKESGRTTQVMRYITSKYTEAYKQAYTPEEKEQARYVELTVKEISGKFKMTDPKAIKAMASAEIDIIAEMWVEWFEYVYYDDGQTNKKKKSLNKEHHRLRLIGYVTETVPAGQEEKSKAQLFKRGKLRVRIDEDFAKYLQNRYIMAIPDNFYAIVPKKNPCSVAFYDKIMTHYRSNVGKSNQNIIKVKTLVDRTDLPRYEDIAVKGEINRRIFTPFERDMDALQELELIKKWDYCKPNGIPLTKAERQKMTYQQFISYDIFFLMPDDYPAMTPMPLPAGEENQ